MSGTPKHSSLALTAEQMLRQAQESAKRAREAAEKRRKAAEKEKQRRLEELRAAAVNRLAEWKRRMESEQSRLFQRDHAQLAARTAEQEQAVAAAGTCEQVQAATRELDRIQTEFETAAMAKRRHEEAERLKSELERLSFEVSELEQQLALTAQADSEKFDAAGRRGAVSAIGAVRGHIASGNAERAEAALPGARAQVGEHRELVSQRKEAWLARKSAAESAVDDLAAHVEGLRSDTVLARWQPGAVAEAQAALESAQRAIANEQFEQPTVLLESARTASEQGVAAATESQKRADQRDYITDSIASTLESMGFYVRPARDESPGQPDTAKILAAETSSGKAIHVSVPVEGEVWYNVEGYAKSTESAVGGGKAAVCDEAEEVLDEMRAHLEEEFGVQAGEVMWDGKDPNRVIVQRQQLPKNEGASRSSAR